MDVVQCQQCGGSVVYDAKREHARCLFCAGVALEPRELDEELPQPESALAFGLEAAAGEGAFRRWVGASWWRPRELREVAVGLQPLWIPAWRVDADVETHWAGLESASTKSGKRPISGTDVARARALVPASGGLTEHELQRLAPFDRGDVGPWAKETGSHPYEPAEMSLTAAMERARVQLAEIRRRAIAHRQHVSSCRVSIVLSDIESRLLMLPVYIGSFRYRDRPWRFVINASTGQVVGRAPLDRVKVTIAILVAVAIAIAIAWWSGRG